MAELDVMRKRLCVWSHRVEAYYNEPKTEQVTHDGRSRAQTKSKAISRKIVNGRGGVTPDMAIRFEKVFGSSAETWLRLQLAYDLAEARTRESEIVATVHPPAPKDEGRKQSSPI